MAAPVIKSFLGGNPLTIAFIPFAAVDNDYGNYGIKVTEGLAALPYKITVVQPSEARLAIEEAEVIMVGGGNTFKLLHHLYEYELMDLIKTKVNSGTPYIGWSAGANIAGLTIGTTNDMPIIEPKSFKALGLFPFQINPHYLNVKAKGHNGETRDERLSEYLKVNPNALIIGLPEGTALRMEEAILTLLGEEPAILFRFVSSHAEVFRTPIRVGSDISFLRKTNVMPL